MLQVSCALTIALVLHEVWIMKGEHDQEVATESISALRCVCVLLWRACRHVQAVPVRGTKRIGVPSAPVRFRTTPHAAKPFRSHLAFAN